VVYVVVAALLLFLGGISVVGLMGVKVLRRVKRLSRSVAEASERIAEVTAKVEELRASQPR